MKLCGAPCSWGVSELDNPHLPTWEKVLSEASQAGYAGIELGPYGFLPLDISVLKPELEAANVSVIAGTIFDDLVSADNFPKLQKQVDDICALISQLPQPKMEGKEAHRSPYLVIIDFGHDERDFAAGHPDKAPRLSKEDWDRMILHIKSLAEQAKTYGVRPVIHPHAGGYIEFADEIADIVRDIDYETAGLCLDTGHLHYSRMDPVEMLRKYRDRLDYIHFKDIKAEVHDRVLKEHIRFFIACDEGVMCPIGEGVIEYEKIRDFLQESGYSGFITIEQERDPRELEGTLDDVRKSLEYLRSVGY